MIDKKIYIKTKKRQKTNKKPKKQKKIIKINLHSI